MRTTLRRSALLVGLCLIFFQPSTRAVPPYSEWSVPVNMGPVVNSVGYDSFPAISKDNLALYISSSRPMVSVFWDIWVSRRASEDAPWGEPVPLPPTINTPGNDCGPTFSRDGHWMVFVSDRPGGYGKNDLWASWRRDVHDDMAWETPVNLGPLINTGADDGGPTIFEGDGTAPAELYFASGRAGAHDIYVSRASGDGTWGAAELVPELSSAASDARPQIMFNGLEIYFHSTRPGSLESAPDVPSHDLWVSRRASLADPWETPAPVPVVNTTSNEVQHALSPDGTILVFASNRTDPGRQGPTDLYISTRTKPTGRVR